MDETGIPACQGDEADGPAVGSRREKVKERLETHPCLIEHLEKFFDGKRPQAYKCLASMVRRGEIKFTWFLRSGKKGGHPKKIWSNRYVEETKRPHEVWLTGSLLALGYECRRLDDVDQKLLPDAEIIVNGELHYVEGDTGTERGRSISDRLAIYGSVGDPILWIVPTEERRRSLRAKDRNENSYFGVYEEVVNNPRGKIWLSVNNQLLSIE